MNSTLISLELENNMRLVVYFDNVDIKNVDDDQLYHEAVKRIESNGISASLVNSWDIEPC